MFEYSELYRVYIIIQIFHFKKGTFITVAVGTVNIRNSGQYFERNKIKIQYWSCVKLIKKTEFKKLGN